MDWFLCDNGLRHERVKSSAKYSTEAAPNGSSHREGSTQLMGKNLFEDMVKFLEKSCEKLSLYSVFILFGASFSTSVTKL